MLEKGGDEWGGRGKKSHRRTGEAGSGLRWRGGDGTDINPSNACLSVFLLLPSLPSLFQVPGERRRANIRIRYLSELWAALTRDLFAQSLFIFEVFFFFLACVKRRSKVS